MRALRYIWASPNTVLGLLLVPGALLAGGRIAVSDGSLELSGRLVDWILRRIVPLPGGARALTLGHVILGRDEVSLRACHAHERVHVRQYERWGPLFLPAYALAGLGAVARGAHAYRDNRFEVEARGGVGAGRATGAAAPAEVSPSGPRTGTVLLAFAAIYVIWGSTYLAIRFAVETIPPFLMLAARFGVAGLLLYAWLRVRGRPAPARREWLGSAAVGGLLLVGGTGAVAWAEQWIASGLAALIVAVVPVWMVLLDWLRPGGRRPGPVVVAGLLLGLVGVGLLVGPVDLGGGGRMQLIGALVVVGGTMSWATGSVHGWRLPVPAAPRMAAALQMTMGGLILALVGTAAGEWSRLDPALLSIRSILSLLYLIVFGSIIAFGAYVFLLRVSTPARVGSYAYVNPVVAVFLGWALGGEAVSGRTVVAAAIIISGVALVVWRRATPHRLAPVEVTGQTPASSRDPERPGRARDGRHGQGPIDGP